MFCPYCSGEHQKIDHGGPCPKVKSIEYYPDGTIKKVEFKETVKPKSLPLGKMEFRCCRDDYEDWYYGQI